MPLPTILLYNFLYILLTLIFSKCIIAYIRNVKQNTISTRIFAAAILAASIIDGGKNEY